jgi:signal transduction histidine kinase
MLKTIIRNLVTNAIKFTGTDGHIDISAVKTPSDVTISVRDNGTGITSDYIAKLFDLSHINTAMGEVEEKGTTLGLFLCKEFVEKSGGKIWAESVKGKGCEFKFTLPVFSEK